MIPSYSSVIARIDPNSRVKFNPSPPNRVEAATKAGEVRLHLAWGEFQWNAGAYGDALLRFESAEIAAAGALFALLGARVAREHRGMEHLLRKEFLAAAFEAVGTPVVSVLELQQTTKYRNTAQYDAASAVVFLDRAKLDVVRQRTNKVRKSLELILAEADIMPVTIAGYPPPIQDPPQK